MSRCEIEDDLAVVEFLQHVIEFFLHTLERVSPSVSFVVMLVADRVARALGLAPPSVEALPLACLQGKDGQHGWLRSGGSRQPLLRLTGPRSHPGPFLSLSCLGSLEWVSSLCAGGVRCRGLDTKFGGRCHPSLGSQPPDPS